MKRLLLFTKKVPQSVIKASIFPVTPRVKRETKTETSRKKRKRSGIAPDLKTGII
jgi:hypothetical protein